MTRRAKRENLQQKQILVPELCDVHPFPASLWRKAVCLPAMLYRINCLLIAEELRRCIAVEACVGYADRKLNEYDSCPALRFGFCDISQTCTKQQELPASSESFDNSTQCQPTGAVIQTLENIHINIGSSDQADVMTLSSSGNCDKFVNSQNHATDVYCCCKNAVCHNSEVMSSNCVSDSEEVDGIVDLSCRNCASCYSATDSINTDNSSNFHAGVDVSEQTVQYCSFSLDADTSSSGGPSPCDVIQALTMSNANDFFNLERLETIGDSFLKFAISIYLYCMYPGIHEGKLSYLRSIQVSWCIPCFICVSYQ